MVILFSVYGVIFLDMWQEPNRQQLGLGPSVPEQQHLIDREEHPAKRQATHEVSMTKAPLKEDITAQIAVCFIAFMNTTIGAGWEVFTTIYCVETFLWSTGLTKKYKH